MTRINFWAEKYTGENSMVNYFYMKTVSLSWWKQEILVPGNWKYSVQKTFCACGVWVNIWVRAATDKITRTECQSEYSTKRFWMWGYFSRKELKSELPRDGNCISKAQASLILSSVLKIFLKTNKENTLFILRGINFFFKKKSKIDLLSKVSLVLRGR